MFGLNTRSGYNESVGVQLYTIKHYIYFQVVFDGYFNTFTILIYAQQ